MHVLPWANLHTQLLGQHAQALGVQRVVPALPHVAQQCTGHKAVDAAIVTASQRLAQQGQRVERMACRHLQRRALRVAQPGDVAVGPVAFGGNASRPGVGVLLQQRAQQHGFVGNAVAQPLQRIGQALVRQPGVRRNKVQIKRDVLHGLGSCAAKG